MSESDRTDPAPLAFWSRSKNGGYGDRLAGMACAACIATALGKPFKVLWDEDVSAAFEDYERFDPESQFDVRLRWIDNDPHAPGGPAEFLANLQAEGENSLHLKTVLLECNQPWHQFLWANSVLSARLGTYARGTTDAWASIYSAVLVPSQRLVALAASALGRPGSTEEEVRADHLLGVQVRCGDRFCIGDPKCSFISPESLETFFDSVWAEVTAVSASAVFVTSDNNRAYELALSQAPTGVHVLHAERAVETHFDHVQSGGADGMLGTIAEHLALSWCKAGVVTGRQSNFGTSAALAGRVDNVVFMKHANHAWHLKRYQHQAQPVVKTRTPAG